MAKVESITSNYMLEFLAEYVSMHSNFHVKLLKPFIKNNSDQFPLREPERLLPIMPEDN